MKKSVEKLFDQMYQERNNKTDMEKLAYAKKAVQSILDEPNCLVDMHGIAYWAGEVERLRQAIKASL